MAKLVFASILLSGSPFVSPPRVLRPCHRNGKPQDNVDFECILDQIEPRKYDEVAIIPVAFSAS